MAVETISVADPPVALNPASGLSERGSELQHPTRPRLWLWISILALAAALPYLHTLGYGFVYDDRPQIVDNRDLQSLASVPRFFTQPIMKTVGFHDGTQPVFYRPLFFTQLCLTRVLFGPGPFGFHLCSLLFHIANTILLYLTATRLGAKLPVVSVAGLLFAVHPVHVESVVWPSASPDLMALGAILCALLAFLQSHRPESARARYLWLALSLIAFLSALFVKETALVTVPVLAAIAALEPSCRASALRRRAIDLSLYLGATLFYLVVRSHIVHGFAPTITPASWVDMARTWPGVLWFYECHLILPIDPSLLYDYDLVERATMAAFWLPFAAVILTLILAAVLLRRDRSLLASIAVLHLVLPIPLVLNFRVFYWRDLVHDRYLYIPSAGLCILAALALCAMGRAMAGVVRPSVQQFLAAALLCVLALTTIAQALPWRNNLLLLRNAARIAPGNIAAQMLLGDELESRGNYAEARICYERALPLTPAWGPAWFAYGRSLLLTRDTSDAILSLRRAAALDDRPLTSAWLALALNQAGREEEARLVLAKALAQDRSILRAYESAQQKLTVAAGD